jgi:hypothetical protein
MSKKSRRRNKKLLLAGAALFGASKLGMLGSKDVGSSNVVGKTDEFRKSFVKKKPNYITKKASTKVSYPRLKVDSVGNVTKDGVTKVTDNKKTLFINRDSKAGTGTGIYKDGKKVKSLNQKSINVLTDGKIETGGKTYENKKAYSDAMKLKRSKKSNTLSKKSDSDNPGLFGFTFKKSLFNKGTMVKARGGGMARMKPTKLY